MKHKSMRFTGILTVLLVLLLAACAAPGAAPAAPAEGDEAGEGAGGEAGTTQLDLWMGGEPETVNAFTDLVDQFEEQNPGVQVEVTFVGSDLFNPTLLPALNAGTGPDIFATGTGPGQPAAIIEAGHALDLTPYYCEMGWNEVIPDWVVTQTSSDGKLWAVGDSVETTIVFYNTEIFEEHGLSEPTTWEEFLNVAQTLKDAGYETPIALGGADKWPISHWQSMLWGRFAGPEGVDEVMFGDGSWTEEPFVEASRTLAELNEAGYFGPSPLAISYDDVMQQFWRGDIPMAFTGTWVISEAVVNLGEGIEDFDVFQLPPVTPDQQIHPTESIGTGWYINADTEHPDLAADLLDFIFFREESRNALLESGESVPVGPLNLDAVELPSLSEAVFASTEEYAENGSIPAFLDTIQPANVTNVTYDGLQALLAGQMTPEQFNEAVQAAWEEAKAEDLIMKAGGGVSCE